MVKGINKVILIGYIGANTELKYIPNGNSVINLSVATTTSWKDTVNSSYKEKTEWHRVVLYSKLAETLKTYLHKGVKVYVEGSLRTNKWIDKVGVTRYTTEVIANTLLLLNTKDSFEVLDSLSNENNINKEEDSNTLKTSNSYDDDLPF